MDDREPGPMVPIDRDSCLHCDSVWLRLEAVSRQLDQLEWKIERRINDLLLRLVDSLIYGQDAGKQGSN